MIKVKCIINTNYWSEGLEVGKWYDAKPYYKHRKNQDYLVYGVEKYDPVAVRYNKNLFITLNEYREQQLDKILNGS